MSKSFIFVKNVATEIKKYYEELLSENRKRGNTSWSSDSNLDKQRIRDILGNKNKDDDLSAEYSWFSPKIEISDCGYWHIDYGGTKDMVIVTWDSPTQIVIDDDRIIQKNLSTEILSNCSAKWKHENIENAINMYNLEVFTPNLGDVYYLKPGVVHRTDPEAQGKPRLVLRIFEPLNVPGESK